MAQSFISESRKIFLRRNVSERIYESNFKAKIKISLMGSLLANIFLPPLITTSIYSKIVAFFFRDSKI